MVLCILLAGARSLSPYGVQSKMRTIYLSLMQSKVVPSVVLRVALSGAKVSLPILSSVWGLSLSWEHRNHYPCATASEGLLLASYLE